MVTAPSPFTREAVSRGRALFLVLALAATSALAADGGPDCRGFGGKIHGQSACARLDLKGHRIERLDVRVMPGQTTRSLGCEGTLKTNGHSLKLVCTVLEPHRRVTVSVSVDGKEPLPLDTHQGFWDQINICVGPGADQVDFTIDYLVLD